MDNILKLENISALRNEELNEVTEGKKQEESERELENYGAPHLNIHDRIIKACDAYLQCQSHLPPVIRRTLVPHQIPNGIMARNRLHNPAGNTPQVLARPDIRHARASPSA